MAEDERPTTGDGFDDWLDEEPGPDTDPYASLSSDDDESEIAEWMAFTEGSGPDSGASDAAPADDVGPRDAAEEPRPAGETSAGDASGGDEPIADPIPSEAVTEEIATPVPQVAESDDDDDEADSPTAFPGDEPEAVASGPEAGAVDDLDAVVRMPAIVPEPDEATEEIPVTRRGGDDEELAPATSVEVDEFDGGGRADTDEIPIIAAAEVAAAGGESRSDDDEDAGAGEVVDEAGDALDADEDTGELPLFDDEDTGELPIAAESDEDTGELPIVAEPDDDVDEAAAALGAAGFGAATGSPGEVFDLDAPDEPHEPASPFGLSRDDYLSTATREHEDLAAAIAEAETEETEQVALAAPIPGLESTVVGFDDVVEAEGHSKARARRSGDLLARVVTAVVLVLLLGASLVWRPMLVALATGVFLIGAGEFYTALRRSGRAPIALFGFIGILGASIGAFVWGAVAIPVSFFLVLTLLLLFYAVVPDKVDPLANVALTITVMVWVGLGTYAMMIIESEDYRPLVIGVVLTVAVMDIAQYFVGRGLGRHQLSPWVSPKKTVEGLIGGVIVALALGALLHFVPPFELTSGLAIGAAIAVLSPMGDLAMSAAKRSLDIKDMGSILPGHGGFLDRIDGLLFVIPAAWAIFSWAGLI